MLMRKYACCYAQGRPGARHFRTHIAQVSTPGDFCAAVEQHFPRETSDPNGPDLYSTPICG